jgi:WD40 repeat protein
MLVLATTMLRAQNPAPTPTDKRDLGLQLSQQPGSQTTQTKSKEAKPELVLQTGYSNFFGATRLAFSPDGRLLATSTFQTNTIKLWETATGRELRNLSGGGQNTSSMSPVFAFSPDSRLLATTGANNSIKVWEVANGREVQTLTGGQASLMSAFGFTYVAFSGDGKKLVAISDAIRVWDTSS